MRVLCNVPLSSAGSAFDVRIFGTRFGMDFFYDYIEAFPDFVANFSDEWKPDVVFLFYPEFQRIPPWIEFCRIPIFAFVSDWNLGYWMLEKNLGRFDAIFTDKVGTDVFRKAGFPQVFHWNMYGWNSERFASVPTSPPEWDIVFVGNVNPEIQKERTFFVKRILDLSKRWKVRVETNIFGQDYVNLLQSARIIFNRSIRGEANVRVFEALAVGRPIFLEKGNLEVRDFFADGTKEGEAKQCILYEDEQLENELDYWLTHAKELEQVAKNAATLREKYSFAGMLHVLHKKLLGILPDLDMKARPFLKLSQHERIYQGALQSLYCSAKTGCPQPFDSELKLMDTPEALPHQRALFFHINRANLNQADKREALLKTSQNLYREICSKAPTQVLSFFSYAAMLRETEKEDEELQVLEKLLQLLVNDGEIDWQGAPSIELGKDHFMELNMAMYPGGNIRTLLLSLVATRLAYILVPRLQISRSVELLRLALRNHSTNPSSSFLLGKLLQLQEPLEALAYFRRAYGINPFDSQHWPDLVKACLSANRKHDGLDYIDEMRRMKKLSTVLYGYALEEQETLIPKLLEN